MKLVERLQNRRFRLTIATTVWIIALFGIKIAEPYYAGTSTEKILGSLQHLCLTIAMIFIIIQGRDDRAMKTDPALKEILNDEKILQDRLKASRWGFGAAVVTAFTMGYLTPVTGWSLPTQSACFIILAAAFLGLVIPALIYMKR